MRESVAQLVTQALAALQAQGVLPGGELPPCKVERPKERQHGDFSVNSAMVLARAARMKPRELAERILAALPADQTLVREGAVAGPGFINFFLHRAQWLTVPDTILAQGRDYGRTTSGRGRRVQVEFVSANPTGPMHVGHGRGAVTGDVLATLLAATGFAVEREYYINDAGVQVGILGTSVLHRYRELFAPQGPMPDGCYPAPYVADIARALWDRDGDRWLAVTEPPRAVIDFAIDQVLGWIRHDLERLNIRFDHWFSELDLHRKGMIDAAVEQLASQDLIYQGVLEAPKGKQPPEDWEPRPQLLFRATRFGDEVDRPLKKSDGSYTYFAADIAYHFDKARRGFDQLVNVWGADHGGYVKRVQAALEALTGRRDLLDVQLVQMVSLFRDGEPVKMSKRGGTFITLEEVVSEVGADPVRFLFLTRSSNSRLDFDLELAKRQSNDNPVFYVQYAHARVHSLEDKLAERGLDPGRWDPQALVLEEELELIRQMSRLPEVVEGAALAHEPHRLPYYLMELAGVFHAYYNATPILVEDPVLRGSRLKLARALRQVVGNGLSLLGVSTPERM
ncbi:MAG: arginine--tRNA ligase [Magnetococcales bacterium]|nr:arginine--tRNA ligase [Magnetococcales bacterium]